MKKNSYLLCLLALFATLIAASCKTTTTTGCFDKQLLEKHKNDACPENCPGVKGCDGKTYCNECMANQQGIRVVK